MINKACPNPTIMLFRKEENKATENPECVIKEKSLD